MTFEEAWPEIKEGKEFRIRKADGSEYWSEWHKDFNKLGTMMLSYIQQLEFQIKREPREWLVSFEVKSNGESFPLLMGPSCDLGEKIKVREVLD